MSEKKIPKQKTAKAVYITDELEEFLKDFSKANNRKYKPGTEIFILASMMKDIIVKDSIEYKEKIASIVKTHKNSKLERAAKALDALEDAGLELKQKGEGNET